MKCITVISCFFFGQLSVSFLGPCCSAPLYCIAVHDCLMLTEQINDDDDDDDDIFSRVQYILENISRVILGSCPVMTKQCNVSSLGMVRK